MSCAELMDMCGKLGEAEPVMVMMAGVGLQGRSALYFLVRFVISSDDGWRLCSGDSKFLAVSSGGQGHSVNDRSLSRVSSKFFWLLEVWWSAY